MTARDGLRYGKGGNVGVDCWDWPDGSRDIGSEVYPLTTGYGR